MYKGAISVFCLAVSQLCSFSVITLLMVVGPLTGKKLASEAALATVPITFLVLGMAISAAPTAMLMERWGRKCIFVGSALLSVLATLLAALAFEKNSFWFFSIACGLIGISMASMQQYRFAVVEFVDQEKGSSATSAILLANVFAAFLGPEIAWIGKDLSGIAFQGSMLLISAVLFVGALLLLLLDFPQSVESGNKATSTKQPLKAIVMRPPIMLAMLCAGIGYAVMTLLMTATPLGMTTTFSYSIQDVKWVIQAHMTAMFLPSFLTPFLINKFGLIKVILIGISFYLISIMIGLNFSSLYGFWWSLVLLGVGWNFIFIAATGYLVDHYNFEERFRVQAVNEGVIFALQSFGALSSGIAFFYLGWEALLISCLLIMIALLSLIGFMHKRKCCG